MRFNLLYSESNKKFRMSDKIPTVYLDDSCCMILANNAPVDIGGSWPWLHSISSPSSPLLSCGGAADVPTFLSVFSPQLLNHDCCCTAPERTDTQTNHAHTHTQSERYT